MLKDKVAIVTGGARGLGYSMAQHLGAQGARVVICDLDAAAVAEAAKRLETADIEALPVECNVASTEDLDRLVQACRERFGRLDILVNNAGGSAHTPLKMEDVTEEHFDRVMNWNVRGTFFCIQRALPLLKVRGGSVINISSIAGRSGTELVSPQYSAAKAGIVGMSRNLAKHLGPDGIRVNVIAPGFIKSGERVEAVWRTRDETAVLSQVALRRRGEMPEIGQVAVFLASDASSYITGAVLDVNGGFMMA
ncbi:SDR family oxidoreductase [Ramlibacter sp. G-1-2-2]|uniref:SDR family oxidoreductase n=1 Tax=Ramlibacter agri TaxID=2728837 RepID=A0A848HDS3_9BURK|nr:SDR family NAD(P)-dependent oxidoreductase [Ramlibacter agri]NML45708.1 SDR family oxidoreductase [Ramlibacter agri]